MSGDHFNYRVIETAATVNAGDIVATIPAEDIDKFIITVDAGSINLFGTNDGDTAPGSITWQGLAHVVTPGSGLGATGANPIASGTQPRLLENFYRQVQIRQSGAVPTSVHITAYGR